MKILRRRPRTITIPAAALTDPMALVTALAAGRLTAGMPVAHWDHDQVDRQLIAADQLLRALDPREPARRHAA